MAHNSRLEACLSGLGLLLTLPVSSSLEKALENDRFSLASVDVMELCKYRTFLHHFM